MTAYYNEIEPYCVEWLRNLIAEGLIAPGDVDDRSIADVKPDDLRGYTQCHFFAGIGGWSYALRLAGYSDDRPVWTGSCPCQPFSNAGKRAGFADDRHLWPVWQKLIAECRPAVVFGEQVASATQWLGLVRSDLEAMEYAVGAMPVQAASAGADHLRDRYWFVADSASDGKWRSRLTQEIGESQVQVGVAMADSDIAGPQGRELLPERADQRAVGAGGMADTDISCARQGREQRSGQQRGAGGDKEACAVVDDTSIGRGEGWPEHEIRSGWNAVAEPSSTDSAVAVSDCHSQPSLPVDGEVAGECSESHWLIGADGKARRVKSRICSFFDGVSFELAGLRAVISHQSAKEVIEYAEATRSNVTEVLRTVRQCLRTDPFWTTESVRGQGSVCEAAVLLDFLLRCESACKRCNDNSSFPQARGQDSAGNLRILRTGDIDISPPCGRESNEQSARESTDPLLSLSLLLARYAETDQEAARDAYAESIPLLTKNDRTRVATLRAFGNAIDPRPATEFIGAFMDIPANDNSEPSDVAA